MLSRIPSLTSFTIIISLAVSGCSESLPQFSKEVAIDGLYGGALSNNASHAIIGSLSHGGSYWQLDPAERLFDWNHSAEQFSNITSASISPDGKYVMTSDRQTMGLWDAQTGENITFWRSPAEVLALSISNNTERGVLAALALDNNTAVIFNASRGRIVREFLHENRVRSVDISSDGQFLLSGSEDKSAVYWSVLNGRELSRYQHQDDVRLVKLSDSGKLALSVSKYDKAMIWNTADASEVGEVPIIGDAMRRGRTFASASFNRQEDELVTGSSDRVVQLWRLADMTEIGRWELPKRSNWRPTGAAVIDVGFNDSGKLVAIASNGFVHHIQP